ncbi:MAG: hypothetical protein HY252_17115 [Sphingobacteriales bacterium]|nr:hypothetical protein [Sphingobacteriales bacterium]
MKKSILILLICAGVFSNAKAQDAKDFRSFDWGAPSAVVQQNEKTTFSFKDNDNVLVYRDMLGGYNCSVIYGFNDNDKLVTGNYVFTQKYSSLPSYESDYLHFKNLLIRKYGEPVKVKEYWNNSNYITNKRVVPEENINSTQQLMSKWVTDRSIIQIAVDFANNIYTMHIQYTAKSPTELLTSEEMHNTLVKL